MKFVLSINCDNAAFADDPDIAVAQILHEAAYKLEEGVDATGGFKLYDENGNPVGSAEFVNELVAL